MEERIEDAKLRKSSIEMETITLDNIYKLMLNFGKLYDIISDEEKKSLITYLIKEIQIYPNGESEQPLKSIEFNFPIYRDGQEVRRLLWAKGNTVEMVDVLGKGIANICYVLNPEIVVLGGGIMEQEDYLKVKLENALEKWLVQGIAEKTRIAFAKYRNNAGMLGAFYHFKQMQNNR